MTLVTLKNQLLGFLCQKDIFSVNDFDSVKLPKELEDQREPLIKAALDDLSSMGMIKPVGATMWILTMPLNAAGQEVHLSMPVCNEIADVINTDLEAKGVEDRVDALNLHEGHIIALLAIIDEILGGEPND